MGRLRQIRFTDFWERIALREFLGSQWVYVLLVVSVVVNVLLARSLSNLKLTLDAIQNQHILQVEARVPPLQGDTPDGRKVSLDYTSVQIPTILYVFTPQCSWCKKNLRNLHALIDNSGSQYQIVGVSLSTSDLSEYLKREGLSFPVFTNIPESIKEVYHFGGTPTTIVISQQARVLRIWHGAYDRALGLEIERYTHVHMPVVVGPLP